jgi:cellobionic acid phosphorylase
MSQKPPAENPVSIKAGGGRCELSSPVAMPHAAGFLWNPRMLLNVNCRGFVTAMHMQPEPAKYAHAPVLEQTTFMQPEQPVYAHHPGRFVYIRIEDDRALFSLPYEPVRKTPEVFRFVVEGDRIRWIIRESGIEARFGVQLPPDDVVELWSLELRNTGTTPRRLAAYPCFTIGYMSWMNQSARYRPDLGGIVASSVTPYQKLADYARIRALKDRTFLIHDREPDAWETAQHAFEGEGGLHRPDGIMRERLGNGEADYETPTAVLQYGLTLAPGESQRLRCLFGPARDDGEIRTLRARYLAGGGFRMARQQYSDYSSRGRSCMAIATPDPALDDFANHWMGRQLWYHGSTHRLTTDPQTRNFLQDAMGMAYLDLEATRDALCRVLRQQNPDGSLPDGIRMTPEAELKYINQVPHSDPCVWLPICLGAYLDESGDFELLDERLEDDSDTPGRTVFERTENALHSLLNARDNRGLSLIGQGDWCDPMNMVGHRGRGVSAWLSMATIHALRTWSRICEEAGRSADGQWAAAATAEMTEAVREYFWNGDWYARGITDDGRTFGVSDDEEGRIFLNPQAWAMITDIAGPEQRQRLISAVEELLESPCGVEMLAPAFTRMHEDIGRLTQKSPGSAENGSIYNHAAAFYAHGLYRAGEADRAWRVLRRMIPGPDTEDLLRRGQLPVFLPNYYRGAWRQLPRTAGRSSHLFNTGTIAWFCRILVEDLFGLRGCAAGLRVRPALPGDWRSAQAIRLFRGATFRVNFQRDPELRESCIRVDGRPIQGDVISDFKPGQALEVQVTLP